MTQTFKGMFRQMLLATAQHADMTAATAEADRRLAEAQVNAGVTLGDTKYIACSAGEWDVTAWARITGSIGA